MAAKTTTRAPYKSGLMGVDWGCFLGEYSHPYAHTPDCIAGIESALCPNAVGILNRDIDCSATTTVTFNAAKVQKLLEHSRAATLRRMTLDQQMDAHPDVDLFHLPKEAHEPRADVPPGLWLTKDEGIYLMSNGDSNCDLGAVYAQGYREPLTPRASRGEKWQTQRQKIADAAGPDDFTEFIEDDWTGPVSQFQIELVLDDEGRLDYWEATTRALYRTDDPRFDRSMAAHASHDA